jgi:regulator of sigma E protease
VTTVLATVFVLGVLIFVHELGHFAIAKWVGIGVPRFSIGLGPKIFSVRKGETEYRLAWIPFGGYVKMAGDRTAEAIEGGEEGEEFPPEKEFDRKPIWARLLVVSAGSGMNFVWAIFVFSLVFYNNGAQTLPTTTIGGVRWPLETAPAGFEGLHQGSVLMSVDGKTPESWDEFLEIVIEGEDELHMSWVGSTGVSHETTVSADESLRHTIAVSLIPHIEPEVGIVRKGGPAEEAGILEGDRFVSIEKDEISYEINQWVDAVQVIHASPEVELLLTMLRGDSVYSVKVIPDREQIPDSETTMREVGLIGIQQVTVTRPLSIVESITEGASRSVFLAGYILDLLGKLITGDISPRLIGGPILVGQMAGESAKQGFSTLLSFMALFSVNLAVLNMLPVPVLDGGHVVFLFIEFLRRKPLSIEQRARVSQVGFILLILLMVLVTFNDSLRLLGF